MAAPRQYQKRTYEKYEMSEKRAPGEKVKQLKVNYLAEKNSLNGKTYWQKASSSATKVSWIRFNCSS